MNTASTYSFSSEKVSFWSERVALWSACAMLVSLPVLRLLFTEIFLVITLVAIAFSGHYREKWSIILKNPYIIWLPLLFFLYWVGMFYSIAPWHIRWDEATKNIRFFYPLLLVPFFSVAWRKEVLLMAFLIGIVLSFFVGLGATLFNHFSCIHLSAAIYEPVNRAVAMVYTPQGCLQFATPDYPVLNHIAASLFDAFAAFVCLHKVFKSSGKIRYFFAVVLLLALIHLFEVSTSRTGECAFLGLLALFVIQQRQFKVFILTGLMTLLMGVGLWGIHGNFYDGVQRVRQDLTLYHHKNDYSSTGLRLMQAKNSYILWKERPLFGFGSGGYDQAYYDKAQGYVGTQNHWLDILGKVTSSPSDTFKQNQYLSYMVDLGLLGLFLFLAWIASACWYAQRLSSEHRFFVQGLMLTLLMGSFSDQILYLGAPGNFFIVLSSLLLAYRPREGQ